MSGETILLVEDDSQIRKFLRVALEAHGFVIHEAIRGADGISKTATEAPDLVVLDLGLPDFDGKQVIERIREWSKVPILVLSVRNAEDEKVAALDAGADDYIVKPFGIAELLARMRVALRKKDDGQAQPSDTSTLAQGALVVDLARHSVTVDGEHIRLTRKEFDLLVLLMRSAGRILTHKQLLSQLWGPANENDVQYLRVFVGRLRQKLGDDPTAPRFILNEPGVGYRLIDEAGS
ncbi:response regulator [Pararhizobium haloflavum]|uniref:response regulator n=1 Tax=Pararhizobium haloflavum TaxID=2037914 RepID=UPI000C1A47F2|nr:response regulator [Pararhizobium haloflavum]